MDKNEIEYDLSLTQFLLDNVFSSRCLVPLLPSSSSWGNVVFGNETVEDIVNSMKETLRRNGYENGCVFTLPNYNPTDYRKLYVFGTSLSSHEIRKRVKQKAFL